MAGYSSTPLIKKLGIRPGDVIYLIAAPPDYFKALGTLPENVKRVRRLNRAVNFIHLFSRERHELKDSLPKLMRQIVPDGMIWISWPKKASGVASTITEDVIREVALPLGLVDVKVCAVDDVWSGLKLVIRRENRK